MSLDLPSAPVAKDANSQAEWRHAVRRALLGWRSALDAATHQHLSHQVQAHFSEFLESRAGATVGFYWPIQNEIDLRPVIARHLEAGEGCLASCTGQGPAHGLSRLDPPNKNGARFCPDSRTARN